MSVLTWRVLDKHSYQPRHFSPTPESETEPWRDLEECVCMYFEGVSLEELN